jgi:hypothetical protein
MYRDSIVRLGALRLRLGKGEIVKYLTSSVT